MLASDLAMALDASLLMRAAGMPADPWQSEALRSVAMRELWLCSRQAGKSSIAAVLAVHTAIYHPGAPVLLLSPSLRQSSELFRKCLAVYRAAGRPVAPEAETALHLELENGSRIISLPGKEETVRGYSGVRLLIIDEAARVPDALYYSVRPMLAVSAGRFVALSTPFGKRGWFHHEWTEGGDAWRRVEVTAAQCPRISPAFLAEERASLGEWWYKQEYECQFVETINQVFVYDLVMASISADVKPLFQFTGGIL